MNNLKKSQSGYGLVAIILVVVLVGLVGGTGWYVWQNNKTKPADAAENNSSSSNNENSNDTTPVKNQNIVKIAELDIQITVPDYAKDLIYEVQKGKSRDGKDAVAAIFSTNSIRALKPDCDLMSTSFGSLARVAGQYPTGDDISPTEYGQLVKQFRDFYLSMSFPNGGGDCQAYPEPQDSADGGWKSMLRDAASAAEELKD